MAIRIPEGYVFVRRAPGVAAQLLEAVEKVDGDRVLDVRTVTGGYHVRTEVAEQYQADFPEADAIETIPGTEHEPPYEAVAESFPDESWKVAEIDDYAKEHGVAFPADVTTKAQKVAHLVDVTPKGEATSLESTPDAEATPAE